MGERVSAKPAILVVGGGPAGLMAAITAARNGATVTLLEELARPGLKLLATGGGRCNISNTLTPADFLASFGREGRFMQRALYSFGSGALSSFFADRGVELYSPDGFHLFPRSERALDIQQILVQECRCLGVEIISKRRVSELIVEEGRIHGARTGAEVWPGEAVILATGGRGYPGLSGSEGGYHLAASAGHRIIPPVPGLVALTTTEEWPGECAGIVLANSELSIDTKEERKRVCRGEILFTHEGISGPAAINLSGRVNALLLTNPSVRLRLCPWPERKEEDWLRLFCDWAKEGARRTVENHLATEMPRALAGRLIAVAGGERNLPGFGAVRAGEFSGLARKTLARLLSAIPLTVTASSSFDRAMVTRGGVDLQEIDPRTLESRLVRGLYFAGEVMDLDGPCGGYNLQWAFSSGHLAGFSAAEAELPEAPLSGGNK